MSLLIKDNSESINGIKSQKDIILEKIHRIKSYNNNLVKGYFPFKKNFAKKNNIITPFYSQSKNIVFDSNQNSIYKKVFIKPLIKKNKIYITRQKYQTNNYILDNNSLSKIKILNKDINNIDINNDITNYDRQTNLNKETSLNETTSDYDIEKISKFHNNNTIYNNNIDNNIIDDFSKIKTEKKNNNIINLKNNSHKRIIELNRLFLKNNNNINDIKIKTTKGNDNIDNININSINIYSNNHNNKKSNPLYLSKLISLSNTINEIKTNSPIIQTDSNIKDKKIHKKYKKKFYLNDTNVNVNKTNEDIKPKENYYTSLTEANPYSKIEEIEITGLNISKPKDEGNNKFKNVNFLETKRKILSSIEKEKQKIINESIKNYRKYLNLIQKQQQEYEEYDQYLKNELNNNQNNKMKLKLFKEQLTIGPKNKSNYNILKNKKLMFCRGVISPQGENKTISTKNFDMKKHRNKIMQKFNFLNKDMQNEKRLLTSTEAYEPLLSEDNEYNNLKYNLKSYNNSEVYNTFNKKILNIDNLKFKKIDLKNKDKNKKRNFNINLINKTKNKKTVKKIISNLNPNILSSETLKKSNRINTEISNHSKKLKNNNELKSYFHKNNNKVSLTNIKKRLILKKIMKNFKNEKIKSKQICKRTISTMNNTQNNNKSLKKLDNYNNYIEQNISGTIPFMNIQEIHRMITEEKKKALNKLNNNNIIKYKENKNIHDYYTKIKSKEVKEISKNIKDDQNTQSCKVKNGLYYSAFKPNKKEEKRYNF